MILLGHVREIARYPVKSMAGDTCGAADLGWHGLAGDRRLAFRRLADASGFPWLTASRLPELILYRPLGAAGAAGEALPTHARTPSGAELELRGDELRREVAGRLGADVELMHLRNGIFDDAALSVISLATAAGVCREAGVPPDHRRFRANVLLDTGDAPPFREDSWVGGTLLFGEGEPRAAVRVTSRDLRCAMVNLDPETAERDPRVLRAVARLNESCAGVYATVVQAGPLAVGQPVYLA